MWEGRGVLPGEEVYLVFNNASNQSFPAGICCWPVVSAIGVEVKCIFQWSEDPF